MSLISEVEDIYAEVIAKKLYGNAKIKTKVRGIRSKDTKKGKKRSTRKSLKRKSGSLSRYRRVKANKNNKSSVLKRTKTGGQKSKTWLKRKLRR